MHKKKSYIIIILSIFCQNSYSYDYNQTINVQDITIVQQQEITQQQESIEEQNNTKTQSDIIIDGNEQQEEEMLITIKKEKQEIKQKPIKKYNIYLSKKENQLVIDEMISKQYITNEEIVNKDSLATSVKKIQHDYNLTEDGVISRILAFNISSTDEEKDLMQVKYNQEIPNIINKIDNSKTPYYIIVNIPSYQLSVFDSITHMEILRSRVVIGKQDRRTPLINTNITHVKYNPDWTPPPSIVKKDILPSLEKGGKYIKSHNLIAYSPDGEIHDIDELTTDDIYEHGIKFRQPASSNNALGVLKFETDNNFNIYLHDTNQKYLFKEPIRSFSSGCIRVEKFKELASIVVNKPIEYINTRISNKKTIYEKTNKIPVFITYLPAFKYQEKWSYYPDIYRIFK